MGRYKLVCRSCQKTFTSGFHPTCECGGMTDPKYSLKNARIRDDKNPLVRFFDLLPVRRKTSLGWLGDGNTPTIHARELGKRLGLSRLYLKNETTNPTRTTKDRMASVVLSFFKEAGVSEFACSSTGNSSTSFARGVEMLPGFKLHVFVGKDFLHRMNFDSSSHIKVYWVKDATFAEAHECARAFAQRNPEVTGERGFFNPGRREGLKLAFLEGVLDMPEAPHWYFQASSSGMGVYGAWRGAQQLYEMGMLRRLPRLACVQQESCAPMVSAWRAGSSVTRPQDIVHKPVGIAEAILRGNPSNTYPHLYNIVRESGGTFETVNDREIREAQRMILDTTGIECCEAAATTVAAIRKMAATNELHSDDIIFANITGATREQTVTPREYVTLSKADLLGVARPQAAASTAIVRASTI